MQVELRNQPVEVTPRAVRNESLVAYAQIGGINKRDACTNSHALTKVARSEGKFDGMNSPKYL